MNSYLLKNLSGITSASIEKYLLFTGRVRDDTDDTFGNPRGCLQTNAGQNKEPAIK